MNPAMNYRLTRAKDFTADRAWGALAIASMRSASVKLHWTNAPYIWHINTGEEVFAVLDGVVDMHVKTQSQTIVLELQVGDIFFAGLGCEHVAHPRGEARILVVEQAGSI